MHFQAITRGPIGRSDAAPGVPRVLGSTPSTREYPSTLEYPESTLIVPKSTGRTVPTTEGRRMNARRVLTSDCVALDESSAYSERNRCCRAMREGMTEALKAKRSDLLPMCVHHHKIRSRKLSSELCCGQSTRI